VALIPQEGRVRRFWLTFIALSVLVSASASHAEADKKAKKKRKTVKKAPAVQEHSTEGPAPEGADTHGGPFTDLPRGHWAYEAVQKASASGILQGWNGRFHGGKVVTRYQMAVVVARMIDRVGVLKEGGKTVTGEDVQRLEALMIEFADELALLNVKVSKLEDVMAGLKRDVDLIKADMRGVGARAGFSGTMQARWVHTDDIGHAYRFGNVVTQGAAASAFPVAAATTPLVRYRGVQTAGAGNLGLATSSVTGPAFFDNRQFATLSNFSINIDRKFDPHTHFHAQIELNGEGSNDVLNTATNAGGIPDTALLTGNPAGVGTGASGRGNSFSFGAGDIFINEAYVTFNDWFSEDVAGRVGVFALPMNTEVNGPSRTYQWTITPSVVNSKWESMRPVGLDIFQHNPQDELMFYIGAFTPSDLQGGEYRSGTLLSQNTGLGGLSQNDGGASFGGAFVGIPGANANPLLNVGRFPTPAGSGVMTDQPRGILGLGSSALNEGLTFDDIGYYGIVGFHPKNPAHQGFNVHAAYFDRNGDLRAGADEQVSRTDWYAFQFALSYQWRNWMLAGQYYDATSKNYSLAEIAGTPDTRRQNTTPFANAGGFVLGQRDAFDTESNGFFALVNWQFSRRGSATMRFEHASDETGPAYIKANIWTLGFNWRTSDHGWFQAEYIAPDSYARSENGVRNDVDIDDDLLTVNYKYHW
jgi:hypothetical protein